MDKLGQGTVVLVVGLAVVFSVLIIIMLVTSILGAFMKNVKDSAPEKAPAAAPVNTPSAAPAKAREFVPGFDTEDGELVAVIASSISAYLNTESGNLKIRSIRKVN